LSGKQRQAPGSTIAIENTTVINVIDGSESRGVTVVVSGDRVTGIGGDLKAPVGAIHVDGTGKFLIPGLWDMHSHNQASGEHSLPLYLANGVVGTRDMGSDVDFILPLRNRINSGQILGPEIVAAGPILDDAPGDWPFRRRVKTADEARQAVRELKAAGVDLIKVHNFTPRDAFFAIIDEARTLGVPVAGHIPLKVTVMEGIASGMVSIEHLSESRMFWECPDSKGAYDPKRCAPIFDAVAARNVSQAMTGAFSEAIPDVFTGKPLPHQEYASRGVIDLNQENLVASKLDARTLDIVRSQNVARKLVVRELTSRGVQLLAGCDGWVPGFCLQDELQWLTDAGLSPLQALQTATINAARFLRREATQGTVATGKRADLVLLDADPRPDIGNVRRIAAVIVRGHLIDARERLRILDSLRSR
ncbi:MAG TPA: amidohydrolase family protein, partial [Vicinamibacterales bacterium]|nr:amidohydrolase family protein [Vicinamibacterales bacterium]